MSVLTLLMTGLLASPIDGAPGIQVVKVWINKDCKHGIEDSRTVGERKVVDKKVKRAYRDVLVWRVQSECPTARKVRICPPNPHPLICVGDPETATIDAQFEMRAAAQGKKETTYIVCTVKWPEQQTPPPSPITYTFHLYAGPASGNLICPGQRDYELALEVVP